jgi:flagellar assembly protein FliH
MSPRLNLAGASVRPFQFPSLGDADDDAVPPIAALPPKPAPPPANAAAADPAIEADASAPGPAAAAEQAAAAIDAELARARDDGLQRGFEEGRAQGYAAGFAEGSKAGEAMVALEIERLATIVGRLGVPIAALEQPIEEAVAALALEVARCVIGDEVKRSREFLVRLVREAIAKVPLEMGAPRVLLNPADLDLIRRLAPQIEAGDAALVGDDTIEAGGAVVVADGEERQIKDRRWNVRNADGVSQVNLTLSSRWRAVMLTLFDGEDG